MGGGVNKGADKISTHLTPCPSARPLVTVLVFVQDGGQGSLPAERGRPKAAPRVYAPPGRPSVDSHRGRFYAFTLFAPAPTPFLNGLGVSRSRPLQPRPRWARWLLAHRPGPRLGRPAPAPRTTTASAAPPGSLRQ